MGASWLDFKLGFRMLVRYPVLTVVGGLAMAFAIAASAGTFEAIKRATDPDLPLPDGERIVGFTYWDSARSTGVPTSAYDFFMWRDGLRTMEDIGAFRLVQRNLATIGEAGEPAEVAEISAAAFRVTRTPPLKGRTLAETDEAPGAPAVVVLGHRLWQTRFGGDSAIVGRDVRLGDMRATVVGVMPEGFAFPFSQNLWTPLHSSALPREPGRAGLRVFGRLAPGQTIEQAQAEVLLLATRASSEFPDQYANLKPQVLPYAQSMIYIPPDFLVRAGVQSINLLAVLFLVVVCGNVALLMFARAATREREIVVRSALGASRARIVTQLFVEALVLGTGAALVGLTAADLGLKRALDAMQSDSDGWAFWLTGGLSTSTLIYGLLLTLFIATITGIVPALKITGGRLEARLRAASAGGGGVRMGRMWTALIVVQIAATVLFTAVAYVAERQAAQIASTKAAFAAEEYLAVRLEVDEHQNYSAIVRNLARRVAAEPTVASVTLAERLPLMPQTSDLIEVDDGGAADGRVVAKRQYRASTAGVDAEFFDAFGAQILAGRALTPADQRPDSNVVVVNKMFAELVFAGRNPIGQRIRYLPSGPGAPAAAALWLEIVGVSSDLVPDIHAPLKLDNPAKPAVYRPLGPAAYPVHLAVRVKGNTASLTSTLRALAADISPTLRLADVARLDQATGGDSRVWRGLANGIAGISAITLVLSLAGIYAVVSFAVTRRTREIAVRVALGAEARSVLAEIFRRPLTHVAAGVALGCAPVGGLMVLTMRSAGRDTASMAGPALLLLAYAMIMVAVCALACVGPARRVLRVQPTEALREEQ